MFEFDLNNKSSIMNFVNEGCKKSNEGCKDYDDDYDDDENDDICIEDPENNIKLAEGMFLANLNPDELRDLCENTKEMNTLIEEGILSEKTIVKFDKNAKLSRAESQAVIAIAREKKDKDFNRLIRCWKQRKILLERLNKKYGSQAKIRAKQMIKNANKSKSPTAKKVAKRASK